MARSLWSATWATRTVCTTKKNHNIMDVGTTTRSLPALALLCHSATTKNLVHYNIHSNSTNTTKNLTFAEKALSFAATVRREGHISTHGIFNIATMYIFQRTMHASVSSGKLRWHAQVPAASSSQELGFGSWQPSAISSKLKTERESRTIVRWMCIKAGFKIRGSEGEYEIIRFLGEGSFGEVYQARSIPSGLIVAIKTMPSYRIASQPPEDQVRVVREISAMMTLRHPHIIGLYDIAYDPYVVTMDSMLSLVMEFMPGGDMDGHIRQQPAGMLPEPVARRFFQQLIDGVSFCHSKSVTHRDLKPGNLLLDATRTNLKVADFGLSAIGPTDPVIGSDLLLSTVGTLTYEAPEVVQNGMWYPLAPGYMGPPADVYSCGCILYHFLSGTTPFQYHWDPIVLYGIQTTQPVNYPKHVFSPGAVDLLGRLLHTDPAQRITSKDIYQHPWFKANYTPPDYTQIGAVQANRAAVESLFSGVGAGTTTSTVPGRSLSVELPRPAVDWKHREVPVSNYAFGYGYPRSMGIGSFAVDESLTFVTTAAPNEVVKHVMELVKHWGFQSRVKNFTIDISGKFRAFHGEYDFMEPLEVLVDILSLPAEKNRFLVEFRRVTGDPADYHRFRRRMIDKSKHIMQLMP